MRQICDVVGQGPVSTAGTTVKLGLNGPQKRFKVDVVGFRTAVSVNSICSQHTKNRIIITIILVLSTLQYSLSIYLNSLVQMSSQL